MAGRRKHDPFEAFIDDYRKLKLEMVATIEEEPDDRALVIRRPETIVCGGWFLRILQWISSFFR